MCLQVSEWHRQKKLEGMVVEGVQGKDNGAIAHAGAEKLGKHNSLIINASPIELINMFNLCHPLFKFQSFFF